jgi:hypothetical protein
MGETIEPGYQTFVADAVVRIVGQPRDLLSIAGYDGG